MGENHWDVTVKIQGNLNRNQKTKMDQKQFVSKKIRAPNVEESMLHQKRDVSGLNMQTAASGFISYALCVVIGVIIVVSKIFEKNKKLSKATNPPSVRHLNTLSGEMVKKGHSGK
jgi:hypothetical protein